MNVPNMNYKVVLITSLLFVVIGIVLMFGFPWFLHKKIRGQVNVAPGSSLRGFYEKAPVGLDFRVIVFNVTNKDDVIRGKKPKLEEVGPYYFEEWKEKFDLVDDDEEDTVTYHYRNKFIFRPELSGPGLTGDEIITMPHPMIMGMLLATNYEKKPFLPKVDVAIKNLFNNPADGFFTGRAMDVLFDGVPIDCSSTEDTTAAICLQLEDMSAIKRIDDKHFAFSILGGANYTDLGVFKVYRGKKNSNDVGRVISFNGDTEMNTWEEDECNTYQGTDSTIFASMLTHKEALVAFEPSICRSLAITYRKKAKYNGIPVALYEADFGEDVNIKPCFCRAEGECPPKGTIDLYKCAGTPMFMSLPHFYLADPKLLEGIESGLNPDKEKHGIYLMFEGMTGSPLAAAKRSQFSLEVKPIPEIEIMKDMPDVLFPLFWAEEGVQLGRDFTDQIKNSLFLMIKIVKIVKWVMLIGGVVGSVFAVAMMLMKATE